MNPQQNKRQRKSERIASILGDSFADRKDERALMAAMIDNSVKEPVGDKTRWNVSKAAIHSILMGRERNSCDYLFNHLRINVFVNNKTIATCRKKSKNHSYVHYPVRPKFSLTAGQWQI